MTGIEVTELLVKLKQKLGPYDSKNTKNGYEYSFRCPFCQKKNGHRSQKKKLSVRIDERQGQVKWKCWVADCSERGVGTRKLLGYDNKVQKKRDNGRLSTRMIIDMFEGNKPKKGPDIERKLPQDFEPLWPNQGGSKFKGAALEYLWSRGISNSQIMMYDVGCSRKLRRIVFPSYDDDHKLSFWTARTISDKINMKWKHSEGYNNNEMVFNEFFINWSLPVMVVQGVFDWLNRCNAVPLLGGSLTKRSKLYKLLRQHRPKTILRLDNDANMGRNRIYELLSGIGLPLYVLRYDKKDLGQYKMGLNFLIDRNMRFVCDDPSVYVEKVQNPLKLVLEVMS